jgi:hypothetical protein
MFARAHPELVGCAGRIQDGGERRRVSAPGRPGWIAARIYELAKVEYQ